MQSALGVILLVMFGVATVWSMIRTVGRIRAAGAGPAVRRYTVTG